MDTITLPRNATEQRLMNLVGHARKWHGGMRPVPGTRGQVWKGQARRRLPRNHEEAVAFWCAK